MNQSIFVRKLVYIFGIIVLAVPLYFLGQPSQQNTDGRSAGGTLNKLRDRYDFGQTDLGKLDPASEGVRLGTLGLRGVASTILWNQAERYKNDKEYDRFSATLDQIALLQPHFVNVWEHQAHNLTYNISVEFDDYEQRFEWVKKGIAFLIRGTKYNERQPIMQWHLGKYNGQKIGTADEKVQYRELFRNDTEFHEYLLDQGIDARQPDAVGPDQKPDNWLVGRLWFEDSYDLVADGAYCKKTRYIYYSDSPKCRLRQSEAIEDEGILDDRAKFAWGRAEMAWRAYGDREIRTTEGPTIRMNGFEDAVERRRVLLEEFNSNFEDEFVRKVTNDLYETLTDEERLLLNVGSVASSDEDRRLQQIAKQKVTPTYHDLAGAVEGSKKAEMLKDATELKLAENYIQVILSNREGVAYSYWRDRAISEQSDFTLDARMELLKAQESQRRADVDMALEYYERGFAKWNAVFQRFPVLLTDSAATDVGEALKQYKRIRDEDFDDDFPLSEFVAFREKYLLGGFDEEIDSFLLKFRERAKYIDDQDVEVAFGKINEGQITGDVMKDVFAGRISPIINPTGDASDADASSATGTVEETNTPPTVEEAPDTETIMESSASDGAPSETVELPKTMPVEDGGLDSPTKTDSAGARPPRLDAALNQSE
jgi:hypothetical protein